MDTQQPASSGNPMTAVAIVAIVIVVALVALYVFKNSEQAPSPTPVIEIKY